ncbi:MAG: M28 family metallopeptidase [Eubacteriales bacterium]
MELELINKILADTAYVRMGGRPEERKTAEYLISVCNEFTGGAYIEKFPVDMGDIKKASLTADGREIPCKGYMCCGSGSVEGELYYLRATDSYSLSLCRGKIVMIDTYLGYWRYRDLMDNGAIGFITFDGNVNYADRDIDSRELRSFVHRGDKMLGVNINAKDAVKLIEDGVKTVKIEVEQEEYVGNSQNVVLEMKGEREEYIVFTAHYDSTSLSTGAFDNMSGCLGLLHMIEYFSKNPHSYSLRFVFCGSEERGLLGSKAYCETHGEELDGCVLCINLDMIGSIMGKFICCCTAENQLVNYLAYMGLELGFPVSAYQGVYSSDSTPFSDKGVPSVSFARHTPPNTATIHNSYDTKALLTAEQIESDSTFITAFAARMANAVACPVARKIPDNMKQKLDEYLLRKKPEQK